MEPIRTVELFAGVGGFRLGLEAASDCFQVVWANQWEPSMREQYAFACYEAHFGKKGYHVCQDIAQVKKSIPEHDLLVGGFPCQDYSIAKKRSAGIEGPKGVLWWQIDDIIREKRPKYVLLENVDRLIRSPGRQYGRDFSIMLRCFYEKGYAVEWRVINAAQYGQAQRRRRIFILAYHNDTEVFQKFADDFCIRGLKSMHQQIVSNGIFIKAFPIRTHERTFTDNWIDLLQYSTIDELSEKHKVQLFNAGVMLNGRVYSVEVHPEEEPFIPIKAVLETGPIEQRFFLKEEDMSRWTYEKGAKHEKKRRRDGSSYIFSEGAVAFPDPWGKPSRTMLTSESKVGRTSHVVRDIASGRLRVLTPVECERLNGFPDDWTNTGMPEQMRYFVMGNALVVPIVTRIGNVLSRL